MDLKRQRDQLQASSQPNPGPGFETEVISVITGLVAALPAGTATLSITRVPGHQEWPEPHFAICPRNANAVPFKGTAVATDLNLTVGHSWREFYGFARGGTIVRKATWEEELRWIWSAVVAGDFTERLTMDPKGYVIAWDSKLVVNGEDIIFRNGRSRPFFGRWQKRVKTITYEPYFQS